MRLGAEEVGHERDYEGLRDRLIEADRQRRVLVARGARKEGTKRCRGTLRIAASMRSSRAALPSSSLASSTWTPMTSTMCREMRFAHRLHGNALHSCWSWFARPASRDGLTQETECSAQLARLTAGHICMRGDYVRRPDLPVIPTKGRLFGRSRRHKRRHRKVCSPRAASGANR